MTEPSCQLYLITPPDFDTDAFARALSEALDAGAHADGTNLVACVQLRMKDASDDAIGAACEVLRPIAQERGVAFVMNDRPDLAAAFQCDGVHVGQDDGSYLDARAAVGRDGIVGVTCHDSLHLAYEAAAQGKNEGADYVAFGAFFPTGTKVPKTTASLETLQAWSLATTVPCVAIGGVTVENCGPLVQAGADFLAVVAGVWDYKDGPGAAVRDFARVIDKNSAR